MNRSDSVMIIKMHAKNIYVCSRLNNSGSVRAGDPADDTNRLDLTCLGLAEPLEFVDLTIQVTSLLPRHEGFLSGSVEPIDGVMRVLHSGSPMCT